MRRIHQRVEERPAARAGQRPGTASGRGGVGWCGLVILLMLGLLLAAATTGGPAQDAAPEPAEKPAAKQRVRIALIAKSQNNLVFQAAYRGALHASATLAEEYGVAVEVLWESPRVEDAEAQARRLRRVIERQPAVDGIAISAIAPGVVTPLIDRAVEQGIAVVTFDGDAPSSKRLAYFGEDNVELGRIATRRLCEAIGGEGTIAILIANMDGQNAKDRIEGMRAALRSYPDIELWSGVTDGLVTHDESFHAGRATMRRTHLDAPQIEGWVLLSAFPLFGEDGLKWVERLSPKRRPTIVAVDALPPQLPYLRRGQVEALVAQDCFGWGFESVRLLLDRIVRDKTPSSPRVVAEISVLDDAADAQRWQEKWDDWLRRRPGR